MYDVAILQMLVPAIASILAEGVLPLPLFFCIAFFPNLFYLLVISGGVFLYCAPDDARDGMAQFVDALAVAGLTCVTQQPCPDE